MFSSQFSEGVTLFAAFCSVALFVASWMVGEYTHRRIRVGAFTALTVTLGLGGGTFQGGNLAYGLGWAIVLSVAFIIALFYTIRYAFVLLVEGDEKPSTCQAAPPPHHPTG